MKKGIMIIVKYDCFYESISFQFIYNIEKYKKNVAILFYKELNFQFFKHDSFHFSNSYKFDKVSF